MTYMSTLYYCTRVGRYLFLNAIANQLRYPNSHTHYFSCTLLYLFAEANNEAIQEQITRYVRCARRGVVAICCVNVCCVHDSHAH